MPVVYRAGAEQFWSLCAPSAANLERSASGDGDYSDDGDYDAYTAISKFRQAISGTICGASVIGCILNLLRPTQAGMAA